MSTRVGSVVALMCCTLIGGCGIHQKLNGYSPKGESPQASTPTQSDANPLREAFHVRENIIHDGSWELPPDRDLSRIDTRGSLEINPDENALKILAQKMSGTWEIKDEVKQKFTALAVLGKSIAGVKTAAAKLYVEKMSKRSAAGGGQIEEVSDPNKKFKDAFEALNRAKIAYELKATPPPINGGGIAAVTQPLSPDKNGLKAAVGTFNQGVKEFNEMVGAVETVNAPDVSSQASIRIRAFVRHGSNERRQIHVQNYDDSDESGGVTGLIFQEDLSNLRGQIADLQKGLKEQSAEIDSDQPKKIIEDKKKELSAEAPQPAPSTQPAAVPAGIASAAAADAAVVTAADEIGSDSTPATDPVNPVQEDKSHPVPLNQVTPGKIILGNKGLSQGDALDLEFSLTALKPAQSGPTDVLKPFSNPIKKLVGANAGGTGGLSPAPSNGVDKESNYTQSYTSLLDVDHTDFSINVTGNVIFANRFGIATSGPNKGRKVTSFVPAAGAALSLHFRPRTDWSSDELKSHPAAQGFWRTWNAIDPAIGFSVAALPFDENVRIGVGVQGSFYHDIFQFGYGYAINAVDRPQYMYFGISVFDVLNQAGKLNLHVSGN